MNVTRAARVLRPRDGCGTRLMTPYRLVEGASIDQALEYVGEAALCCGFLESDEVIFS